MCQHFYVSASFSHNNSPERLIGEEAFAHARGRIKEHENLYAEDSPSV
jgi:hypothetical protein